MRARELAPEPHADIYSNPDSHLVSHLMCHHVRDIAVVEDVGCGAGEQRSSPVGDQACSRRLVGELYMSSITPLCLLCPDHIHYITKLYRSMHTLARNVMQLQQCGSK